MLQLTSGLKNSLLVLELLRNNEELCTKCDITVGTFTNCRENGLTFVVLGYYDDAGQLISESLHQAFTYCVYEHRSSDTIIINGKPGYVSMCGDLPYKSDSSSDYIQSFMYDDYMGCAEDLAQRILQDRMNFLIEKRAQIKTKSKTKTRVKVK